ncbi:Phosphoglycerate kinase [Burkholderia multivorans]
MAELWLMRHAQASFDGDDYDCLSPLGCTQAARLGAWLAQAAVPPQRIVTGTLRRHAQTAAHCTRAAGIDAPCDVLPGLDELDPDELLERDRHDLPTRAALLAELAGEPDPRRAFQSMFASAVARWMSGRHDDEYRCAWPVFREQVLDAWAALAARRDASAWVFTSGGPIGVIVATLLGVPDARSW